jgi:dihydroxy-acid dehydratase
MINAAVGGSTNFVIHLLAIAGRVGVELHIDDFDRYSQNIPLLTNIQPSGIHYLEDLYYAGGLPAVIRELKNVIHDDTITVNGKRLSENCEGAEVVDREIISSLSNPFKEESGICIVKGNLAPNGAIIKLSAASPHLLHHTGKAVVFENIEDFHHRVDAAELDIDETSIMVLKNVGPKGYPGMAEVGNMSLPKKLLEKGIKDVIRISDGRMSGTGFGTVVLHVSPEAAAGGNIALVENGDLITLHATDRTLTLHVTDDELQKRRISWKPSEKLESRGYIRMYQNHVEQSHLGADLDFLKGASGSNVTRDSH